MQQQREVWQVYICQRPVTGLIHGIAAGANISCLYLELLSFSALCTTEYMHMVLPNFEIVTGLICDHVSDVWATMVHISICNQKKRSLNVRMWDRCRWYIHWNDAHYVTILYCIRLIQLRQRLIQPERWHNCALMHSSGPYIRNDLCKSYPPLIEGAREFGTKRRYTGV